MTGWNAEHRVHVILAFELVGTTLYTHHAVSHAAHSC